MGTSKCPRGKQVDTSTEQSAGTGSGGRQIRRRKQWSVQEKLQIVRETLQSGSSVPIIARRHGVTANQIFTWRRDAFSAHIGRDFGEFPGRHPPVSQ